MEKLFIGFFVFIALLTIIAAVYAFGGLVFAVLWNWLIPSLWHAAPHLTWFQGVAVSWLIGIAQSIISGGSAWKEFFNGLADALNS